MSYLSDLFAPPPAAATAASLENVLGGMVAQTGSGMTVTNDSAMKLSTVYACVRLLSETIAALPLMMFRREADGGRTVATEHPLYDVLHDQPNRYQTAIEFRQMMTAHAILRGNAYARIVPGPRGFVDQLVPIHPDKVTVEDLPDGNIRYRVDGERDPLLDGDVMHLKGLSMDGKVGVSLLTYMRETVGIGLAAEQYGARFFGQGAQPGGVLKMPGKLKEESAKRLLASWNSAHGGPFNPHRVAVLEEGLEWQQMGLTNKDSQLLELREFTAEDATRWFGVPPHMVGLTSSATSWGSGIEQMGIGFVVYTLLPWLKRWEQAITRDLILIPRVYFVEHIVDGLLRGDTASRYSAYSIARNIGVMSPNEIRRLENMNPRQGGDVYQDTPNGAAPQQDTRVDNTGAHYRLLLKESAARVVRKELAALNRISGRTPEQSDLWREAVEAFYATHAEFCAQALAISPAQAGRYVADQLARVAAGGLADVAGFETKSVATLVSLAEDRQ